MAGMGSFMMGKIDQIISEFFVKCLHVILDSRIPFIFSHQSQAAAGGRDSPASSSASSSSLGVKSKDKWFNLVIGDCPSAQESAELWRRSSSESMTIDILLVRSYCDPHRFSRGASPGRVGTPDSWSEGDAEDSSYGTVLERWTISHERSSSAAAASSSTSSSERRLEVTGIYKRAVILIRTLYCSVRTLPAHRLFHLATSSSQSRSFSLAYKVSGSFPLPLGEADEATMEVRSFAPVETPTGRLCISVAYRHTTAITALEVTPPILPRIIADYVGSPTTDPLRRVPSESLTGSVPSGGISGRKGVHVVSLSPSPTPSAGTGIGRRHSWGGALNKLQPTLLPPSSPSFKSSSRSPSPSQAFQQLQQQQHQTSPPRRHSPLHCINTPQSFPARYPISTQPIPIQERRLSPPPNPFSPSPPHSTAGVACHSLESSLARYLPRQTSAPVSIPSGLRAQMFAADRSALPPPSPRRSVEHQIQTSGSSNLSSGARGGPRLSVSTLAESLLLISPPHPYHQPVQDEGPPSGVKRSLYGSPRVSLSRSSSKIHDDADDEEFACPFAVDEDEVDEMRSRSGSPRSRPPNVFESSGPKAQHAAVGALVRMLKLAPPLHGSSSIEGGGGGGGGSSDSGAEFTGRRSKSRPIPGAQKLERHHPRGDFLKSSKTTGEALEELEDYKETLKFFLRGQGGRKCTDNHLPPLS